MTSEAIDVVEDLLGKLQKLRPDEQQLLLLFAEFLLARRTAANQKSKSVEAQSSPPKQRVLGFHQGMGWMSDDFNDPLPDEFWMGET